MKDIAPCLSAVQLTECRLSFEMTSPPEMTISSGVCHGRKDGWLQHGLVTSRDPGIGFEADLRSMDFNSDSYHRC